ncbi:hypothetical protein pb186bvf_007415 [Paramecium bursaria]
MKKDEFLKLKQCVLIQNSYAAVENIETAANTELNGVDSDTLANANKSRQKQWLVRTTQVSRAGALFTLGWGCNIKVVLWCFDILRVVFWILFDIFYQLLNKLAIHR